MTKQTVIAVVAAVALACALSALSALLAEPAQAREWRSWCHAAGSAGSAGAEPLGWHFYCDPEEPAPEPEPNPTPESASPASPVSPTPGAGAATDRILEIRRALEESRAAAILDPTTENVSAYLRLQQETLQRAATFSDVFRRTVWADASLDYTLKRPVGALAKQAWSDARRDEREAALAGLGERYGLIYLGHAGCSGCRVQGPLLRAFALRHGLDVLAVSMTGEALEGWPEAVPDRGRAARLGLGDAPFPAIVLFDARTKRAQPVAFGIVAEDELAERIFVLTQRETGHDY